jgi:hypothetical protein
LFRGVLIRRAAMAMITTPQNEQYGVEILKVQEIKG